MNLTIIFIIGLVVVVAIFDIWLIMTKGKFESISAHIIRISKTMPLVTLLLGILLGHLFWSMNTFDYETREYLVERCKEYQEGLSGQLIP